MMTNIRRTSKVYTTRNLHLQQGVTLLELLIGLAIVSILLTAVAPNVQSILLGNKVAADINALSSALRFARHTAVNEQTSTTICATADFVRCSNDWNNPKMVFVDVNSNGQLDNNETLLVSTDKTSTSLTLSGISAPFRFNADGSAINAVTLKICPTNKEARYARAVLVTAYGKISISKDSNNDGIAEDSNGTALSC